MVVVVIKQLRHYSLLPEGSKSGQTFERANTYVLKQVQVEGGLFRCRVVIPDAKDSEKDILLWWNDGKYAGHGGVQALTLNSDHAIQSLLEIRTS
jgi:hypothetical protein